MEVVADKDNFQKVNHEGPARFQCRGKQVLSVLTKERKPMHYVINKSTTAMIHYEPDSMSERAWMKTDQGC